jgi:hypothetical protein
VLVRYADDAIVMCWSRGQAAQALARLVDALAGLGLEPKAAKTRIVRLEVGGPGFDFLGCGRAIAGGENPIDPSGNARGSTPPARTVNDASPAGALDKTMDSFTPIGVTSYTRSAPSHTRHR